MNKQLRKQNIGFAFLLLGLICAVPADTMFFWIGLILGIVGLVIVILGAKTGEDEEE